MGTPSIQILRSFGDCSPSHPHCHHHMASAQVSASRGTCLVITTLCVLVSVHAAIVIDGNGMREINITAMLQARAGRLLQLRKQVTERERERVSGCM